MIKISVIVPVYNALEDVKNCLASLKENFDFPLGEVIVIDDCSGEDTAEWLKLEAVNHPAMLTLRRNEENLGFVKSCNRGIEEARGNIIVLLNSDTLIPKGFCDKILDCFEKDDSIGIASPIASYSGTYFIPCRDADNLESMNRHLDELRSKPKYPTIPTAEGFCFCFRKEISDRTGPLDEAYGKGYNEERDFCFRAVTNGWRCALIDNLYVYHKRHASFGKKERKKQLKENDKIFKERWADLIKQEKYEIKHNNPITELRMQIYPQYFKKNAVYSKSDFPDKTVYRILGVKITFKKKL